MFSRLILRWSKLRGYLNQFLVGLPLISAGMDYFAYHQEREPASQQFKAFRELGFNYGYQHHTLQSLPTLCSLCGALHMALYLVLPRGPASIALLTRVASHRVGMAARVSVRCLCKQACSPSCVMDTPYVNDRLKSCRQAHLCVIRVWYVCRGG